VIQGVDQGGARGVDIDELVSADGATEGAILRASRRALPELVQVSHAVHLLWRITLHTTLLYADLR